VFVDDFNRDGKPDVLASDGTMNLGKGDGAFTAGPRVTIPSRLRKNGCLDLDSSYSVYAGVLGGVVRRQGGRFSIDADPHSPEHQRETIQPL
jgi:hypothetical protein